MTRMSRNMHHVTRNKGFTLIEAVVATGVFAFIIVSVVGVYLASIQLDRKTRAQRAMSQNARFIMDFIAKEVRNGVISYAGFPGGVVVGTSDLYIENQANLMEHFYLSGTNCGTNNCNLVLDKNGSVTNLNAPAARVTNLRFYLQPAGDPYTPLKLFNQQPNVTVVLELTSNYGNNPADVVKMNLQSTFGTRSYPSRN